MILAQITTPIYYVTPDDREHLPTDGQVICWADAGDANTWMVSEVTVEPDYDGPAESGPIVSFTNHRREKGFQYSPTRYAWFPLPQMEIMLTVKPEAQ